MSRRVLVLVTLALAVTACGPGETATSPAGQQLPAGGLFAYAYEPGTSYTYDFTLEQDLDVAFEAQGDPSFLAGDEAPPGNVEAKITISGTVTYDVASGPQPDTFEITVTGSFDELLVTGTVDGEPIEDDAGLAETGTPNLIEVPNLVIVVDTHGNVIEGAVDGQQLPEEVLSNPFSSFGELTSGGLNGHFGPSFPEEPLEVGDSWSHSSSEQILDQTLSTETTYTVSGVESIEGTDVAVIDVTRSISGLTLDLGEFFRALFEGFAAIGEGSEEDPGLENLQLSFLVTMAPSTADGKVWFDPVSGVTRRFEQQTAASFDMDFSVDDGSQAGAIQMQMGFHVSLNASLIG